MSIDMAAFEESVERELSRRGPAATVTDFLEILRASTPVSEELTAGEQTFLQEHTALTDGDFTDEAQTRASVDLARRRTQSDALVRSDLLTTAEVAELTGRAASNIRRSRLSGDLYGVESGSGARKTLGFPRWQFTGSRVIPGLKKVLAALPANTHPLTLQSLMTTPSEQLDGRSPAQWLAGGGAVEVAVRHFDELAYQ